MIDQIFNMILEEAKSRKGKSLELQTLLVFIEVQEKVFATLQTLRVLSSEPVPVRHFLDNL